VDVKLKPWTIRVPQEILEWIREKAAKETIKHQKVISMNAIFVEILNKAMKADEKKGG
jgi:predicted DNA binding CopG/RHH family protein